MPRTGQTCDSSSEDPPPTRSITGGKLSLISKLSSTTRSEPTWRSRLKYRLSLASLAMTGRPSYCFSASSGEISVPTRRNWPRNAIGCALSPTTSTNPMTGDMRRASSDSPQQSLTSAKSSVGKIRSDGPKHHPDLERFQPDRNRSHAKMGVPKRPPSTIRKPPVIAEALWKALGDLCDSFSHTECANYFRHDGISSQRETALAYGASAAPVLQTATRACMDLVPGPAGPRCRYGSLRPGTGGPPTLPSSRGARWIVRTMKCSRQSVAKVGR